VDRRERATLAAALDAAAEVTRGKRMSMPAIGSMVVELERFQLGVVLTAIRAVVVSLRPLTLAAVLEVVRSARPKAASC
jgi:hypothetical protein